jgi:hypothetical protein
MESTKQGLTIATANFSVLSSLLYPAEKHSGNLLPCLFIYLLTYSMELSPS